MLKIKTNILNPVSRFETEYLQDVFLTIEKEKIISVSSINDSVDFIDRTDQICIPGFIDTHVHLSQYYIRGSHSPNLLHWLNTYTFKEEYRSKEPDYARKVAEDFFSDLVGKGTTTSVIYTAPFRQACDAAFAVAEEKGIRAIIGTTMMDMYSPDFLIQNTEKAFQESVSLYEKWHKKTENGIGGYANTVFLLCCPKIARYSKLLLLIRSASIADKIQLLKSGIDQ